LEEVGRDLTEVLPLKLPGGPEKNHIKNLRIETALPEYEPIALLI
jgi:hypothetical protein